MIKIALIAVSGSLLSALLKSSRSEFSLYVMLATGVILIACCIQRIETLVTYVNRLQSYITISTEYVKILMKMAGIAYIAEITSALCQDCGYQSMAGQVEMFGRLSIIIVSMPVVISLIETIESCLAL